MSEDAAIKPARTGLRRLARFGSPRSTPERTGGEPKPGGDAKSLDALDQKIVSKLSPHLTQSNVAHVTQFFLDHGSSMAKNPISRVRGALELNKMIGQGLPGQKLDSNAISQTAKLFKERERMTGQRDGKALAANPEARTDSLLAKMESGRAAAALERARSSAPARSGPVLPEIKMPEVSMTNGLFRPASASLQAALRPASGVSKVAANAMEPVHPHALQRSSSNVSALSNSDFADAKPLIGAVNEKLAKALTARDNRDNPAPARLTGRGGEDLGTPEPHLIRRSPSASSIGSQFSDARSSIASTGTGNGTPAKQSVRGLTAENLAAHNRMLEAKAPKNSLTSPVLSRNTGDRTSVIRDRDRAAERSPSR